MSVLPGDSSFEQIRSSIFRVEAQWLGGSATATAFVVAMLRESKKLVLATAKHVLDVPEDRDVLWAIQQFDEYGKVARQVSFGTNKARKGDVPYRTHNTLDVGIFVLPAVDDKKKALAAEGEFPVRTIDMRCGASTGTRVAWAGFPGIVEAALGFPQLCYFEGVISAMVNRLDQRMYVVDGHAAHGVSGGPVWQWSNERDRLEVLGIVCNYQHFADGLPGFCFFEPINPVLDYLECEVWRPEKCGDSLVLNRQDVGRGA
ncbi:MAG: hypothetical protein HY000_41715 [Planctomycetes bacterium]|nr:hypothetical protein [Planctomycetota bacterium]